MTQSITHLSSNAVVSGTVHYIVHNQVSHSSSAYTTHQEAKHLVLGYIHSTHLHVFSQSNNSALHMIDSVTDGGTGHGQNKQQTTNNKACEGMKRYQMTRAHAPHTLAHYGLHNQT